MAETTTELDDDAARRFSGMTTGYWGEVTSDYDFCEKNYALSNYVAEFFQPLVLYRLSCMEYISCCNAFSTSIITN